MIRTPYDVEMEVKSYHWWFVVRRRLLRSLLSTLHLSSEYLTLDIGCGAGSNLEPLKSAGLNVIGLDRSIYPLLLLKGRSSLPLINGDINQLPIRRESVGLIIAADIVEHLENDRNGIRECYRALKKGGVLILTVPAFNFLWGIQDVATGHKRRYSREEISKKLRQGGFEVLRASYFNFFLFFPILIGRRMIRILGLKIESENEINSPLINFFLKTIFSAEPYLLRFLQFPFGVSIFCIAQKK